MSSPAPPSSLQNGCSVINNNTLYVYTPNAFQALPLTNGSAWSQLPSGISVTGHTCVRTTENGTNSDSALWVVGGSSNSSFPDYSGLQRFSFDTKTWETIAPVVNVTQNRMRHASVFLNDSSSILIYAGSQNGEDLPTTQTFTISTVAPYAVRSYGALNYPVKSPNLLSWNESSAITLGGSENDTSIYQFTSDNGWSELGTSLANGISNSQECTLVQGTDSSKVLNIYDLSVSPNEVTQIVLQDANGRLAPVGQTVANATTAGKRKRATLSNWPTYNNTFAPTATRASYSLARNDAGLVAISGGNDANPVALFNEQDNAWLDSTQFFGLATTRTTPAVVSTTSSSATESATSASSTPVPAASTDSNHHRTSVILGAVLGSILGFIVLLVLLLLLLRFKKKKQERRSAAEEEKKRMSFADRGAPFMWEAGGAINKRNSGHDSLAITNGKLGNRASRNLNTAGSDSSTTNLVPPQRWDATMGTIPGGATPPEVLDGQYLRPGALADPDKRGSGWSRYFESLGPRSRKSGHLSSHHTPSPRVSHDVSHYSSSEVDLHDCNTHGPTVVPELNLNPEWEASRVSNVITGKPPTIKGHKTIDQGRPSTSASGIAGARVHRTRPSTSTSTSGSSTRSSGPISSHNSLFAREGINEREWTPVTPAEWTAARNRDTSTSSVYTHKRGGSDIAQSSGVNPMPGSSSRSHLRTASASNTEPIFPSSPPQTSIIATLPTTVLPGLYNHGEARVQPMVPVHSDMSWVNLNTNSTR